MSSPVLSSGTSRIWLADTTPPSSAAPVTYDRGNFWLNTDLNNLYICIDDNFEALAWTQLF